MWRATRDLQCIAVNLWKNKVLQQRRPCLMLLWIVKFLKIIGDSPYREEIKLSGSKDVIKFFVGDGKKKEQI